MTDTDEKKQLLHLVFGGELKSLKGIEFKDLSKLDIVGIYPYYGSALVAWRGKAQQTVDNADALFHRAHAPASRSGKQVGLGQVSSDKVIWQCLSSRPS